MEVAGRRPRRLRLLSTRRSQTGALSPIESLSPAWNHSRRLLFRPFTIRRWVALSVICLFLGGGTSTAAFQWAFGALPIDLHISELLFRARVMMLQHRNLSVVAALVVLALLLGLVYARCVLRFVLIDAVVRRETTFKASWKTLEPVGRSYFLWLIAFVGLILAMASGAIVLSFRNLSLMRAAGHPSWIASLLLVTELAAVVLAGLQIAILITLTDDLVGPVMYAERLSLPAAWKIIGKISFHDPGTFLFYLVLRFAVSTGISIAVLIILFPVLMGISTGAIVTTALTILALRAIDLAWAWNPLTITLGGLALGILTGLLFAVLSVAGMPGQVYLQNYGVRFIASRVSSLAALCRASGPAARGR